MKLSQHLAQHTRVRHAKFQNTVHHREPDIKEAPGGLRDWNLIAWLSRLGRGRALTNSAKLQQAGEFLSALRCFLHYQSQGDRNVLDVETQERILAQPFTSAQTIAEEMREYFRHAWLIFNEARRALAALEKAESTLVGNFRDWRSRLSNSEFTVSRERIFLRSPAQLESDPAVLLRLLEFIARHGITPAPETERRLEAARSAIRRILRSTPAPVGHARKHSFPAARRSGNPHSAARRVACRAVSRMGRHGGSGGHRPRASLHP